MAKIKSYCLITLWCLQVIVVSPQEDNNNNNNDSSQVIETHYSGRYVFIIAWIIISITRMKTAISSKAL